MSDLHQEFGEVGVPDAACDCVVLAGDVSTKLSGLKWIHRRFPDFPVVYICGNHEFYGDKLPRLTEKLRDLCRGTHVHFLEDNAVEVGGYWFFGCTLWTDLALHGDWEEGAMEAGESMNDYRRVRNSKKAFTHLKPRDTRALHLASLHAMERFLESHDPARTVVVTHHAPSALSLPEHRKWQVLSCAYASHLDDFVRKHEPLLWIHGHIHHTSDYLIGRTRVIANPRAYPEAPNEGFDARLVIDLDEMRRERGADSKH